MRQLLNYQLPFNYLYNLYFILDFAHGFVVKYNQMGSVPCEGHHFLSLGKDSRAALGACN